MHQKVLENPFGNQRPGHPFQNIKRFYRCRWEDFGMLPRHLECSMYRQWLPLGVYARPPRLEDTRRTRFIYKNAHSFISHLILGFIRVCRKLSGVFLFS